MMEKAAETALDKLVDILKLSPRYLFSPLLLISAFALFAPTDWLDVLGIRSFVADYKSWVGGTFLVSAAFVLVSLGQLVYSWSWGSVVSKRRRSEQLDRMKEKLRNLTDDEKDRLRAYVQNETLTQYFPLEDGVARGLSAAGIISMPKDNIIMGTLLEGFAHNMDPRAYDYLRKHPSLVEPRPGATVTRRPPRRW